MVNSIYSASYILYLYYLLIYILFYHECLRELNSLDILLFQILDLICVNL